MLVKFAEQPVAGKTNLYKVFPFNYLEFYNADEYYFAAFAKPIKSIDDLAHYRQRAHANSHQTFRLTDNGDLTLFNGEAKQYVLECTILLRAEQGYKIGDVLMIGATVGYEPKVSFIYRRIDR